MQSDLVLSLLTQIKQVGLPEPKTEYRFDETRRWRFDIAYPDQKIAMEVDGGTWGNGRHVRGQGYENDCTKLNTAVILGWAVLRFTGDMVRDGRAVAQVEKIFGQAYGSMEDWA